VKHRPLPSFNERPLYLLMKDDLAACTRACCVANGISPRRYLAVVGIMISSASSALGSLFGGSRVLQAIARDDIFPFLRVFAWGSKVGACQHSGHFHPLTRHYYYYYYYYY